MIAHCGIEHSVMMTVVGWCVAAPVIGWMVRLAWRVTKGTVKDD